MKYAKIVIPVLLIGLLPLTAAFGQREAGKFSIGGFGSYGMPMSPDEFKDYFKSGIGYGGELSYYFSANTALAASFTMQPFDLDVDKLLEEFVGDMEGFEVETEGDPMKVNVISANLMQYLTPPDAAFGFFVTVGGGYYMMSVDDVKLKVKYMGQTVAEETLEIDESESKPGINGGAGIEFSVSPSVSVFAGGKYHLIFTEDENTTVVTVFGGIRITP